MQRVTQSVSECSNSLRQRSAIYILRPDKRVIVDKKSEDGDIAILRGFVLQLDKAFILVLGDVSVTPANN